MWGSIWLLPTSISFALEGGRDPVRIAPGELAGPTLVNEDPTSKAISDLALATRGTRTKVRICFDAPVRFQSYLPDGHASRRVHMRTELWERRLPELRAAIEDARRSRNSIVPARDAYDAHRATTPSCEITLRTREPRDAIFGCYDLFSGSTRSRAQFNHRSTIFGFSRETPEVSNPRRPPEDSDAALACSNSLTVAEINEAFQSREMPVRIQVIDSPLAPPSGLQRGSAFSAASRR